MAGNQVDIVVRAVEKGVKETFSSLQSALRNGKLSVDRFNQALAQTGNVKTNLSAITDQVKKLGLMTESAFSEQNMKLLGVRSFASVREEMGRLTTAYRDLATGGKASTGELATALTNLREKQRALYSLISNPPKLDAARSALGVSSFASVRAEMDKLIAAYRTLATSGKASTGELATALTSLREKQKALYATISSQPKLDAARGVLGISNYAAVKKEIDQVRQSYATLASSGKLSLGQLVQAKAAMISKTLELRNSTSLWGTAMQSAANTASTFRNSIVGVIGVMAGFNVFQQATTSAFSFNQTIEQSRIGIAALIRTFSDADMGSSFTQAEEIQKRLQIAGLETTATYEQLLRALQEGIGPALRNGFDTKQIVAFTGAMTQAAAAISLPLDQLGQEMRAIMDGTIDRNARIANALQIKNEDIKRWKEAGTLFEELDKKLKQFVVAGDQVAQTFSGRLSNLKDAIQMALGQGTQKVFAASTSALKRMQDAIVTIDKEAGTFTFNTKIMAALDQIDARVTKFINSITADDIANAMTTIVNVTAAIVDVMVNFAKVIGTVFSTLGPLAPALVTIIGNLTLFGGAFKLLAGAIVGPVASLIKFVDVLKLIGASSIITWLGNLRGAIAAVQLGGVALAGIWGLITAAIVYDIVKIVELIQRYREYKQLQAEIAQLQKEKAVLDERLANKFEEVSKATGLTIKSMKDLDQAVADGKIHYDETVGAWVAGQEKIKKSVVQATDEMKKKYQEYADLVKKIQDDIQNRQMSVAEKLREMGRSGMSDLDAWNDRKKEAEEYAAAAQLAAEESKQAFQSGDVATGQSKAAEAVSLYDKAKEAAAELNREVKSGDTVVATQQQNLKTAMEMYKQYGEAGIAVQQGLQEAIKKTAQEMDAKTGGQLARELPEAAAALAKEMPEVAKAFGELGEKAVDLAKKSKDYNEAWKEAWDKFLTTGEGNIDKLEKSLTALTRDRTITVHVKEVAEKYFGGMVQGLASGGFPRRAGKLPGRDGPDSIRALLAPGEFIIRSAAVRKYGAALFHALNSMRLDLGGAIQSRLVGSLSSVRLPSVEPVRMFAGGAVPSVAGGGTRDIVDVNLNFGGGRIIPVMASRISARDLVAEFRRAEEMSS